MSGMFEPWWMFAKWKKEDLSIWRAKQQFKCLKMLAVQSALWVTHRGLKGAELVWTLTVADYVGVIEMQKCPRVGHFEFPDPGIVVLKLCLFQITFIWFVFIFVCTCAFMCGLMCTKVSRWKSENNLKKLVLPFQHVGPENRTQVLELGCKHLYQFSHFVGPISFF